jgi:hypothetical protein
LTSLVWRFLVLAVKICFFVFQWEDSLEFIQPLATLPSFDHALFQYLILKHKYLELLCIKVTVGGGEVDR